MPTALPARQAGVDDEQRTGVSRPGRSPALTSGIGRAAVRVGALTVCQAGLMTGFGLLITGPAKDWWPMTVEDEVNEGFERIRTHARTSASLFASGAGNTSTVVGITLLVCVGLILLPRLPRWREAIFLAVAVSLQSLVFLIITESVDRTRPDVDRLDASPPTSSYTSGHTGAATALYGGLAVLVLSRVRGPWRKILGAVFLLIPLLVAVARLYRGMHHPTDVAGGLLNGGLSLLIVGRAVLADDYAAAPVPANAAKIAVAATEARVDQPKSGRTTVIVNPTVTSLAVRDTLRLVLAQHGRGAPVFVETTADDPGAGQAADAVREGADLVVVCGGDGTVRTVADALAGTGVALAVVPCGTGNLLARHLGLPLDPAKALHAALDGAPHRFDLGRLEGDGVPATHFTAMSGAGLDAAMLEHTSDRAKSTVGWPAYVASGLRELRSPRTRVTISLDGGPVLHRSVRMVLLANIGTVQGGAPLVPDARPDDGLLDLALYDPHGPGGWLRAVGVLLRRSPAAAGSRTGKEGPVEFFTFRRVELRFETPQPREMDGDPVGLGRRLTAEVVPGALTVLVPSGSN
ncbi:diacylglycerol kinase family protein [Streptomyces sp. NBC_01218]|uniref:diacylglycerol kinase family protein n=1 Tax=unclassified Streptomyces TaxID=2593676 RepID=UPI0023B9DE6C|nr:MULTISPECIES: diacylglycerol kinase family protein [unclassified Streptomyces]WEH38367.1 diacylglycerol kinase family protein [Streptomyces sp. AM 2-1-1]WSQ50024.1 diacylglycerol kinase family protein [Streptomyces sp. NBC_01218]